VRRSESRSDFPCGPLVGPWVRNNLPLMSRAGFISSFHESLPIKVRIRAARENGACAAASDLASGHASLNIGPAEWLKIVVADQAAPNG